MRSRLPPPRALGPGVVVLPLLGLSVMALAGCAGSPAITSPASPEASRISGLFWNVFAIAAAIFLVTELLLIFAVVRFRHRAEAAEPVQVHGNLRLEIAWTLAPAVILAGVFVGTVSTMSAVTQPQPDPLQVRVIGHRWWWEIQYPGQAITTATELHVPVGRPVLVALESADVIHSFWAPELSGKTDAIPGHSNTVQFTAERAGTFRGFCAEYCGVQHANMGFLIIAEPPEQYDDWLKRMQAPAVVPPAGPPAQGAQAVTAGICAGCHSIDGTAAQGKVGPNLTHFGSRQTIAAVTLDNTPENLTAWLSNPQQVKPGNLMVIPPLSAETVRDMVAYLQSLK